MSIISGVGGNLAALKYIKWLNGSNKVQKSIFGLTLKTRFIIAQSFMLLVGLVTLLVFGGMLTLYGVKDYFQHLDFEYILYLLLSCFYGILYTAFGIYGLLYCRSVGDKVHTMITMYKVLLGCSCSVAVFMAFLNLVPYSEWVLLSIVWTIEYSLSILLCTTMIGQLNEHKLSEIDPK